MVRATVFGLLAVLLCGAAVLIYFNWTAPGEALTVGLGRISREARGVGRVESRRPAAELSFATAGRIVKTAVEEGDLVKAGQLLAELDAEDCGLRIAEARAALREAEAREQLLRQGASAGVLQEAEARVARAEAALRKARAAYAGAESPTAPPAAGTQVLRRAELEVRRAELALEVARNARKLLEAGAPEAKRAVAEQQVELARIGFNWAAEKERVLLKKYGSFIKNHQKVDLRYSVLKAKQELTVAQAEYDATRAKPRAEELTAADLQIKTAAVGLEEAKAESVRLKSPEPPPRAGRRVLERLKAEVEAAEARVRELQAALAELKAPPREGDLAVAVAVKARAAATLKRVEAELKKTRLTAPFAGVIVAVRRTAGDFVAPGEPVFLLRDDSEKLLRVELDSRTLPELRPGLPVGVRTIAVPDTELRGRLRRISPNVGPRKIFSDDPADAGGGEVVTVVVGLNEPKEGPQRKAYELVRVGMRAEVEIVFDSRENVLRIPSTFVAHDAAGHALVYRLPEEGRARPRKVRIEIGLRDEVFVEVRSGLRAGDRIVKPPRP